MSQHKDRVSVHRVLKVLPTDWHPIGFMHRGENGGEWGDCSCGCRWWLPMAPPLSSDWGVCCNPDGPRAGLLTFEHQGGYRCFEQQERDDDDTE
jgi:hypothetical protein